MGLSEFLFGTQNKPTARKAVSFSELPEFVRRREPFSYKGTLYRHHNRGIFEDMRVENFPITCYEHDFRFLRLLDNTVMYRNIGDMGAIYKDLDPSEMRELTRDEWFKLIDYDSSYASTLISIYIPDIINFEISLENHKIDNVGFFNTESGFFAFKDGNIIEYKDFYRHHYHVWWCNNRNINSYTWRVIEHHIGTKSFVDKVISNTLLQPASKEEFNVDQLIENRNADILKQELDSVEDLLNEVLDYQTNLDKVLLEKGIARTISLKTYKDLISFINSIEMYKIILTPPESIDKLLAKKYEHSITKLLGDY